MKVSSLLASYQCQKGPMQAAAKNCHEQPCSAVDAMCNNTSQLSLFMVAVVQDCSGPDQLLSDWIQHQFTDGMKLFSRILNLVKSLRLIEPSGGIIVVVLLDRQAVPITLLLILMATLTD